MVIDKDKSITDFVVSGWDETCPPDEWYIHVDVVYPECRVPQLLFNVEGYRNFCASITNPSSEVVRIVWRYMKK